MNEMKLRIARTLEPQFDQLYPGSADSVINDVYAVLRAMRDPTAAMLDAPAMAIHRSTVLEIWQSMIDEAIA